MGFQFGIAVGEKTRGRQGFNSLRELLLGMAYSTLHHGASPPPLCRRESGTEHSAFSVLLWNRSSPCLEGKPKRLIPGSRILGTCTPRHPTQVRGCGALDGVRSGGVGATARQPPGHCWT